MPFIALKGFLNGSEYQRRGRPIEVSGERARELLRLGLIAEAGEKAAQEPQNKMNPPPENKGGGAPLAADQITLLSQNAPEIIAALAEIADPAVLPALLAAEQSGKARKSVVEAIQVAISSVGA
ncbi:hypothetical protein [Achromobacter xylosoxidans]|uniref:hypothetical protein n=1 Tax=Alcaligenes xylosoxydans xylosoxydans TaxID=85698 RepID=UPI002A765990|nr:hypothetical protein [Achromobacter xylosoxidans]WPQ35109.1 hypothetical protein SLH34_31665 [Achromobacter xylosoxidans]